MRSRFTFTLIFLLLNIVSIFGQVQNVKYGINYISGTSDYDCYLSLSSGFAESSENRILNDAQFSIKVETGTSISLVSSNLPLIDNEFYGGSESLVWSISQSVISPASDPQFDYYSFVPDLSQTSRFNDLFQNTEYNLFRISVEGSCVEGVQIFRNGIDPGSNGAGMSGKDFTNSIKIGSTSEVFFGLEEPIAFGSDLSLPDVFSCEGDCVILAVEGNCELDNYTYLWDDGSTDASVTVCPDMTVEMSVLIEGENGFSEQLTASVLFREPFIIEIFDSVMCVGGRTGVKAIGYPDGFWISNPPDIAILDTTSNTAFAIFDILKEGTVSFSFIDQETGCKSTSQELLALPRQEVIPLEGTVVKVGESLSFETLSNVGLPAIWRVFPNDVATIHDGLLYGLKAGVCEVSYYLDTENGDGGCESISTEIIVEENEICNEEGIRIWESVKIGDINIDAAASGSSISFFVNDEYYSIMTYDINTGNAILHKFDSSSQIVEEIHAFTNPNHIEDYNYEMELHDMDQDGLMDVILIGGEGVFNNPSLVSVFRNMGDGSFQLEIEETWCISNYSSVFIEVLDLDNDGYLDIFTSCRDDYYRVFFNDNWNSIEVTGLENSNAWFFSLDYNTDGLIDLVNQNDGLLINDGDRSFTFDSTFENDYGYRDRLLYDTESELLLGYKDIYSLVDIQSIEFIKCGTTRINEASLGFRKEPRFYANINSTTEKEIVVVGQGGFMSLSTSITCDEIGDGFEYFNFGGVANKYKQIDIGNDGYTDFFYIEGNEIFASLNPNSNTTTIKGTCYIDKNQNEVYDTDETILRNVKISTDQSNTVFLTDENGEFNLIPPATDFNLQASVTDGEWIENTLSISSEDIKSGCFEKNYFGFVQAPNLPALGNLSISNSITRCDFETRFYITIENKGNENAIFDLEFLFDDETTFMSSDIPAYTVTGNTLGANIGMISPFSPKTYTVTLKMPSGSSNLPMLDFGAILTSDSQLLDEYTYMDQLRCSYDPNDKRVHPDRDGDDNFTLFDEELEYTIRFQNNGNDTAFVVRIVDLLDPNIEPSSINVISSSHPVETCIDQDTLVFLFEDIYLVDSMTNYPLSQGFVTYSCTARDGIDENTIINNTADIIFDSNDPIITNTTTSTLVSLICTDLEYDVSIEICADESINGHSVSGNYIDSFIDVNGCDSIVNLELQVSTYKTNNENILICDGDTIEIGGMLVSEASMIIDTLESSTGCVDSVVIFIVEFVDKKEVEIEVEICEGDSFEGLTESGQYILDLLSVQGCDSIVTLDLDVVIVVLENLSFTACEGESITILDSDYQFLESTDFIDTLFNANNCPVKYTNVQVTVIDIIETSIDTMICEGEEYLSLSESGNYVVDTLDQITGCPLIINLDLVVLSASDPNCIVSTNEEERFQIELYPNPVKDRVIIKSDLIVESIQIFDMQFRKLFSMNTNATFAEINVRELTSGVYIIRCKMKDQYVYKKMIVR